ncbi:MAG: S8 family serine peptidase [Owenweeksia sp.]|nr:S8 family serine peptidase [Owenweeksia sp.]
MAGTIFGAGNIDPRAEGMAPGAEIYYQDYPDNLNNVDSDFNTQNVRITSSSYSNGCNAGYTNFTRQMDQDAIDNPALLHIFSAGNSGNSNCGVWGRFKLAT